MPDFESGAFDHSATSPDNCDILALIWSAQIITRVRACQTFKHTSPTTMSVGTAHGRAPHFV